MREHSREFATQPTAAGLSAITLGKLRHSNISTMRAAGIAADVVAAYDREAESQRDQTQHRGGVVGFDDRGQRYADGAEHLAYLVPVAGAAVTREEHNGLVDKVPQSARALRLDRVCYLPLHPIRHLALAVAALPDSRARNPAIGALLDTLGTGPSGP